MMAISRHFTIIYLSLRDGRVFEGFANFAATD